MSNSASKISAKISALITKRTGKACDISHLAALSGGANNQTWRFSISSGPLSGDYILRKSSDGVEQGMPKETEARVQQAASAAGIPVAPVAWVLEPDDGLGSGYIMALITGETIPRKILRDTIYNTIRPKLAGLCGEYAAMTHAIDPAAIPELSKDDIDQQLAYYKEIYLSSGLRRPVMELAFRWLEDNRYDAGPLVVVHGDYRNGNFIIDPDGIKAILDWELAHLGDPMEDLGWICVNSWRFGNLDQPVGGFGQRQDMIASYEAASGTSVDPAHLHYWEVMGTLKWGIMCIIMSKQDEDGAPLSVERAAIGRRTSETELDLLELLTGDK